MTKNNTIYLAKITKSSDYEADILIAMEAFTTMEKAKTFMTENDMIEVSYGWTNKFNKFDYDGSITELKVK